MHADKSTLPDLGVTHALLLQGPAGPFMRRFAQELMAAGIRVTKVNFHAGDRLFFSPSTEGANVVPFRGRAADWPAFVERLIATEGIDGLFLFGDGRELHRQAVEVARARDARVWVFEEGYVRPDWFTLEEHGVNGHSRMPRNPDEYRSAASLPELEATPVGQTFAWAALYSTLNALAFTHLNGGYPHYRHHRDLNAWNHAGWHVRGAYRKWRFGRDERGMLERFEGELSGRYFFVPLQVFCDFQLKHSPYDDVEEMIHEVVTTFAAHAPSDDHIVFKHHPMDRPFREYGELFRSLKKQHGLEGRLHYCHDLHLPTLLKHAKGTITINSTVGLQSVLHRTPVITLGDAVYDLPGLTHQGGLEDFLVSREAPDDELYKGFRRWLLHTNQHNGSFYRRVLEEASGTGTRWLPRLLGAADERPRPATEELEGTL